jgi:hypothetical protein
VQTADHATFPGKMELAFHSRLSLGRELVCNTLPVDFAIPQSVRVEEWIDLGEPAKKTDQE